MGNVLLGRLYTLLQFHAILADFPSCSVAPGRWQQWRERPSRNGHGGALARLRNGHGAEGTLELTLESPVAQAGRGGPPGVPEAHGLIRL